VLEQALTGGEQFRLAEVLCVGREVLGRKARLKWRGRVGDLYLMESMLKGKPSLLSCHLCSSYSGRLKLVLITNYYINQSLIPSSSPSLTKTTRN
jgi:hypothetical protein